jgi:hypothetical protein
MKAADITAKALRHVIEDAHKAGVLVIVIGIQSTDPNSVTAVLDLSSNAVTKGAISDALREAMISVETPDRHWVEQLKGNA